MAVLKYWDEDLAQWLPVAPGPKGLKGDKGDQGDQGVIGPTPALTIGTVTTGTAAATLTGTDEDPVLSLVLPSAGADGVNTAAIQAKAVTAAKIADDTITATQIAANAVGASELADNAVTAPKFAAGAMSAVLLAVARAQPVVSGGDAFDGPDPMWETIFGEPFADAGTPSAGTPAHTFDGGAAA